MIHCISCEIHLEQERRSNIFRSEVILSASEDTEYVFTFPLRGASGSLRVVPRTGDVMLCLSAAPGDYPFARWRFDCDALKVHDEILELGGPVLVAEASTGGSAARCWFVISQAEDTFEIGTFFMATDPVKPHVA